MIGSLRSRLPVPAPLAWLLVAVLILGVAWALLTPPFQSPDENPHFSYTQSLVERGHPPGDPEQVEYSREQMLALHRSNALQTAAVLETKPEWSRAAYERYRRAQQELPDDARSDGGGPGSADHNPPLYYAYTTLAYRAAAGGDLFSRLYAMRLLSVLLLLVTVTGAWLLAGEVFGPRRDLQLVTGGVAGLAPMATFISGSVNPDAMLLATWSLTMWLGVRVLRSGLTPALGLLLAAVVALALLTKATSLALLPALALVLGIGAWRVLHRGGRGLLPTLAVVAAAVALPAGSILLASQLTGTDPSVAPESTQPSTSGEETGSGDARAPEESAYERPFVVREFTSYLWQYYLPRLPFQQPFGRTGFGHHDGPVPAYDIWVKGAWGSFGWLEVRLPEALYAFLAVLTLAVAALTLIALWRSRRHVDLAVIGFLGLIALSLVGGLHLVEYTITLTDEGNVNQGRYLLPLLPIGGLAVALLLSRLGPRARGIALGCVLGGFVALQLVSLAITAVRFYA